MLLMLIENSLLDCTITVKFAKDCTLHCHGAESRGCLPLLLQPSPIPERMPIS